eukprot:12651586-Alexandrium_andersonii.AAC.1
MWPTLGAREWTACGHSLLPRATVAPTGAAVVGTRLGQPASVFGPCDAERASWCALRCFSARPGSP